MTAFDAGYWGPDGGAGDAPAAEEPPIDKPTVTDSAVGPGNFDASLAQALNSGSLQEAPGDPKELIAAPAALPAQVPNGPENIVGAPELGPPAPQPATDSILDKLPAPGAKDETKSTAEAPKKAEDVIAEQHDLDVQAAEDAKRQAEAAHIAAIDHQADVQDATDKGNALYAARQKSYDDALQKYNGMKIQDYWDEPGHSKLRAKLAIALGGFGAALSARAGGSTENVAVTQIDKQISDDYQRQRANIESAKDSVVMARTGLNDAREAKAALIEDANAKRTASLQTLETEARQSLAERGMSAAQIDNDQRVLQLAAARAKAQKEADEQKLKDAHLAAQTAYLQARTARQKGGGSGGGTSGGNAAVLAALQKSGGELTPEVAQVAAANHVKTKDLNALANQAKGERRIDLRERGEVTNDVKEWVKDNNYLEKSKKATELDKLARVLQGDKVSGLDKAFVLQEAEKAAKGGTATVGGVNIDMAHMAGGTDKLNQIISKWRDGDFSDKQTQSLLQSIKNQADVAKQEVATAHDDFQQTFRDNPRYAADPKLADEVNKAADRLFGAHGYSRKPAKTEGGSAKTTAGPVTATGGLSPDAEKLVRAKYSDPATSPADRAKAALILRNAGLTP